MVDDENSSRMLSFSSEGISVGCSESQEGSYVDVVSRSSELSVPKTALTHSL